MINKCLHINISSFDICKTEFIWALFDNYCLKYLLYMVVSRPINMELLSR